MNKFRAIVQGEYNSQALDDVFERSAELIRLAQDPAFRKLRSYISVLYHEAAETALDRPELAERMRGFRDGIRLSFALVDDVVEEYKAAEKVSINRQDDEADPVEPDSTFVYGNSPL